MSVTPMIFIEDMLDAVDRTASRGSAVVLKLFIDDMLDAVDRSASCGSTVVVEPEVGEAFSASINIPQLTRPPALSWMMNGFPTTSVAVLGIINAKDAFPIRSVEMYLTPAQGSTEPSK